MLLLPGIAAFTGYQSTSSILDTEADINARLVSQLVNVNPELWKAETLRLEELLRRRPGDKAPESRAVLDLQHRVFAEVKDALAHRILAMLHEPVRIAGSLLTLSGSIGIAMYPQGNTDIDTLLRQADMATYHAKDLGRNTHHFFNDALNHSIQHRTALDHSLQGALERREFVLHYQPNANLASGTVTGVEALIRWQRPGEGLVPPDKFIRALGGDAIQGYLLARPMPADVLTDWMQRYQAGDERLTARRKLTASAADSTRARHLRPVPSLAAARADVA